MRIIRLSHFPAAHTFVGVTVTFHNPPTAPPPAAPYSNLAEIDLGQAKLLVLAGQVALDHAGELVGGDDMRAQTKQVFESIGALLAARGATFADVVNIRTYLADMSRLREYGEIRQSYLGDARPTSTTVEVSWLFRPGALLEVDITAVVPSVSA
jgi:enamine deaminase RidA (YjgF/YER057c/UK114 family)